MRIISSKKLRRRLHKEEQLLVVEAVITELVGINARRVTNEKAGLALLEVREGEQ